MSDIEQIVTKIAALAPAVTGAHAEQITAIRDEQAAEGEILARALHLVAPAGRALASPIPSAEYDRLHATRGARSDVHHVQGVVLLGGSRPALDPEHGGFRRVEDWAIVWIPYSQTATTDASPRDDYDDRPRQDVAPLMPGIYRVEWSGCCSLWQGSSSGYGSHWERLAPAEFAARHDVADALEALVDALEAQAKANRPTKAAAARAAKLRAVLALI
jgi:hypothetical protein